MYSYNYILYMYIFTRTSTPPPSTKLLLNMSHSCLHQLTKYRVGITTYVLTIAIAPLTIIIVKTKCTAQLSHPAHSPLVSLEVESVFGRLGGGTPRPSVVWSVMVSDCLHNHCFPSDYESLTASTSQLH